MPDPSWNITNDNCTTLTGWTNNSSGDATVTTVTEDGRSAFKFLSTGGVNAAQIGQGYSTFTAFTFEVVAKLNSTETNSNSQRLGIILRDNAGFRNELAFYEWLSYPKSCTYLAGFTTFNTRPHWVDATSSTWHTYRLVCTGSGGTLHCFVDGFYYGNIAYGSGQETGFTNNAIILTSFTGHGNKVEVYVDSIKLSTTQEEATQTQIVRVQGETPNTRIASHTYGGIFLVGGHTDPIRYVYGGGNNSSTNPYNLPYVSTSDSNAGGIRVRDNSTTFALEQWPALP